MDKSSRLEAMIRQMTKPINGQYPRPWMTDSDDPASATVFVVGYNQAKTFPEGKIRSHHAFIDSLFNRGKEHCRDLYDRLAGPPSNTRKATDELVGVLERHRLKGVIQTNVICYSTARAADARKPEHSGGFEQGSILFQSLVRIIQPRVLIVHGAKTRKALESALELDPRLPTAPTQLGPPMFQDYDGMRIFPIQSLSGAPYNGWKGWSADYLNAVAEAAVEYLRST
jgi:hypothetical protein